MSLALSHLSAIEIYRSPLLIKACPYFDSGQPGLKTASRRPVNLERCSAPKKSDLDLLEKTFPDLLSYPVHTTVGQQDKRRAYDDLICHINSSKATVLPLDVAALTQSGEKTGIPGALDRNKTQAHSPLRRSLYVVIPELAFLQAASFLSLIDLILFGCELCGAYGISTTSSQTSQTSNENLRDSGTFAHRPFTNTAKISRFIETISQDPHRRTPNIHKAKKALESVLDNSASPRESALSLMITAKRSEGGYALPKPILNQKIPINRSARHLFPRSFYRCDLFWPDANLAVEYDSDKFHSGTDKISQDSSRRGALNLLGIDVITVTNRQVSHVSEMDRVARSIAKKLNHRIRTERRYDYSSRKLALQNRLLDYGSPRA